eukprot:gene15872-21041_t
MIGKALDERAVKIGDELAEAKRLREEAQHLLAEYQRKRKEAEAEAAGIIAAAEREAAALTAEAKQKTEEFVARRNALSEQKIKQAETEAVNAVRIAAVDLAIAAAEWLAAQYDLDTDELESAGADAEAVIRTGLLMQALDPKAMAAGEWPSAPALDKLVTALRKKKAPLPPKEGAPADSAALAPRRSRRA